jgi:hypothetical protein
MKIKYFLFLLLICSSCNRQKQPTKAELSQYEPVKDTYMYYPIRDNRIRVDLSRTQQASLFDYFSHIELIPLETNDDVLIGWCEKIIHYQNKYYIFDRQQNRVFVFDNTGKFIFQINKRGQGPGEYTFISDIFVNPFTETIDILGLGFIYSYDLSGRYVSTYPQFVNPMITPTDFIRLNEKTYVFYSFISTGFSSHRIFYYNIEENNIFHQDYEVDNFLNNFAFRFTDPDPPFYQYQGKWYFHNWVDRIVYEVDQESLKESYMWDFGRHNYDAKKLNLLNSASSISTLPYRLFFQNQNNRYVLAQVLLRNKTKKSLLIHDKAIDVCKLIERFEEEVDFLPRKMTNEYVLSWSTHNTLEKYVTEEMLDEVNRKKFTDLMNEEKEMNPIIIKYYFRQDEQ